MAIWVVSGAWLSQTELLRAFSDISLGGLGHSFLLGVQEGIVGLSVSICLAFIDTAKQFSAVVVPIYIPTKSMSVLVHVFTNIIEFFILYFSEVEHLDIWVLATWTSP